MSFNLLSFLGLNSFPSSEKIKEKLKSREYQKEIASWLESTIRPLGNKDLYLSLAKQEPFFNPTEKNIEDIFNTLYPYTILGSPGHDFGHHSRDILGAAAIIGNDPHIAKALPNDITAAFFGGAYHDLGNGTWPRYQDNIWEAGHAEIGAWLFYNLTKDHLPEHIRRLTAYAISAHTHILKPVETTVGYIRQPWADELFYINNNQTPVGIAIWITRFADRLDTNGISLLCRHIIAEINAMDYNGRNFSGQNWYDIGEESVKVLLKPEVVTFDKTPTALQHLKNFADSGRHLTPYSIHDDKFPVMKELMEYKITQADNILDLLNSTPKPIDKVVLYSFLKKLSLAPDMNKVLSRLEVLLNNLSPDEQQKWGPIFEFCRNNYHTNLYFLKSKIDQSTEPLITSLKPLIPDIIKRISID